MLGISQIFHSEIKSTSISGIPEAAIATSCAQSCDFHLAISSLIPRARKTLNATPGPVTNNVAGESKSSLMTQ